MTSLRTLLALLLYPLGHALSWVTDLVASDAPHAERTVASLYRVYSMLMGWSAVLDKDEAIWLSRHEGESEAAFEARCRARWPRSKHEHDPFSV